METQRPHRALLPVLAPDARGHPRRTQRIDSEVQAEVAKASAFAVGSPTPDPESADQDVYA